MIFHILFNYNQSNQVMDEKIQKVLEEKIHETMSKRNEIALLVKSLGYVEKEKFTSSDGNKDSVPLLYLKGFGHGIIIGRLYNSFHYQSRRILKRNPTEKELSEFTELLKKHETEFSQLFLS